VAVDIHGVAVAVVMADGTVDRAVILSTEHIGSKQKVTTCYNTCTIVPL
jgi:hypothetical protein